ncbi:MAG: hypothetical protein ACOYLO_12655 [Ferruginibacter sp.]
MKKLDTPLVEEHLQSLQGIKETGTDDFFYTRLKARMESALEEEGWSFPLKPVWVIGSMTLLLAINIFMLSQEFKSNNNNKPNSATVQSFAEQYDQTISTSY